MAYPLSCLEPKLPARWPTARFNAHKDTLTGQKRNTGIGQESDVGSCCLVF
jgi:hypothetical protein